ncbi:membrane protein insertion efficiency factor YidD [Arthrobacter russicus]|uniref:Putative membrane protein insertion efficiency factor n=1 Tax=Arthrobacter russicus TaxID=172040 RepID=A0ABU1JBF1_9MICC|nr:membrane protein insertion efficiency factor YidD [Arthrobacter russicus]MDR6269745.1 putative membrane protein insertion efficiency factor [Arthrobacter russicus]
MKVVRSVFRFVWRLPRTVLIAVLTGYRAVISPLYGQVCRYFPSCSGYALEAITVHGAVKGSYLAARRLIRCHPWSAGGIDHVPAHDHRDFARLPRESTPRIVMLNHPERYLNNELDRTESLGSSNRAA